MAQFPSNPSLDSAAVPVRVVSSDSTVDRVANASDPSKDDSSVPVRIVGGNTTALATASAYAFADLPTSPSDWQAVIVTDKAIGTGSTGIMAMWNPNAKAWTGLSGEAIA